MAKHKVALLILKCNDLPPKVLVRLIIPQGQLGTERDDRSQMAQVHWPWVCKQHSAELDRWVSRWVPGKVHGQLEGNTMDKAACRSISQENLPLDIWLCISLLGERWGIFLIFTFNLERNSRFFSILNRQLQWITLMMQEKLTLGKSEITCIKTR